MNCIITVDSLKALIDLGIVVREDLARYNISRFPSRFNNSQPMIRIEKKVEVDELLDEILHNIEAGL